MATNIMRGALPPVRWGAVFAGVAFALAAHVCLGLFGAALGYASEARDSRLLGLGAGLWSLMVAFTASLLGAMLAARLVDAENGASALLHGVLVWCLALITGAVFLSGTMAASVMGVSYAWSGGVVSSGRDVGSGVSPIDAAAQDAATASLLGGIGALFGLIGAVVGAVAAKQAVAETSVSVPVNVPVRASQGRSSLMPPPERREADGDAETIWADPAFDRRRNAVDDRRHHRH